MKNPQQKTILIVGAGMVGISTALHLQRAGQRVILIDRQGPAAGTSYGNGGVLASSAIVPVPGPGLLAKAPKMLFSPDEPLFVKWRYIFKLMPWLVPYLGHANSADAAKNAAAMVQIIGDSLADHQALAKSTKAERYLIPSDYVYAYRDKAHFESEAFSWQLRRDNGFEWEISEGANVQQYEPLYGPAVGFIVRCPNHGRISDPAAYITALTNEFVAQGGDFRIATLTDIIRDEGEIIGVRASGETIACDKVVVTAGIWSKQIMAMLGLHIPLETERGYHMELWNPNAMPKIPTMVAASKFVITPMEGRLRLAGIVEFGGLKLEPSQAPLALLERSLRAAMPSLTWEKATTWMGHRPATTDSLPLIGELSGQGGVYAGFGHHHVGLTGGPKTGRLLAQIILGQTPNIDIKPYNANRYAKSTF